MRKNKNENEGCEFPDGWKRSERGSLKEIVFFSFFFGIQFIFIIMEDLINHWIGLFLFILYFIIVMAFMYMEWLDYHLVKNRVTKYLYYDNCTEHSIEKVLTDSRIWFNIQSSYQFAPWPRTRKIVVFHLIQYDITIEIMKTWIGGMLVIFPLPDEANKMFIVELMNRIENTSRKLITRDWYRIDYDYFAGIICFIMVWIPLLFIWLFFKYPSLLLTVLCTPIIIWCFFVLGKRNHGFWEERIVADDPMLIERIVNTAQSVNPHLKKIPFDEQHPIFREKNVLKLTNDSAGISMTITCSWKTHYCINIGPQKKENAALITSIRNGINETVKEVEDEEKRNSRMPIPPPHHSF